MSLVMTRAETNVLTLARVAVGTIPAMDAMRLFVTQASAPTKLGPTARAALAETLSVGSVLSLARQGGWLSDGTSRLWERTTTPPPLVFTANAIRLFNWVLTTPLTDSDPAPLKLEAGGTLTVAEDALVTLLIDRMRGTGCEGTLARQPALRGGALTVLAHAGLLAREASLDTLPAFDVKVLAPWIEGLRTLFARSWLAVERTRKELVEPRLLSRIGGAQGDVLDAYFTAIHTAGRHDLANFLVDAASQFVTPELKADAFTRSMALDAPLRERTDARRRSAVLLRALSVLREWDQQHRSVRFIDDGYQLAQKLVVDWERLGERGFSRAAELVTELDAIPTLTPAQA